MVLRGFIRKIKSNAFYQNIAVVAGGNAFANLIGVVSAPIITRLYTPQDYGIFAVFSSVIAILGSVATLRYSIAIPLPRKTKISNDIIKLSLIVSFLFSLFITIVILTFGRFITNKLSLNNIEPYLFFIPITIFGRGIYNTLTNWAVRKKQYKLITRTKVSQGIISAVTKIGLGIIGLKPLGLILGAIIQEFGGNTTLFRKFFKQTPFFLKKIDFKGIIYVAKRYKKFPLIQTWSHLLLNLGNELPVLLLGTVFDYKVAGIYGLANKIINVPMFLIGRSVSQVYFGEISNIGIQNSQKIYKLSKSILKKMFVIGLIPVMLIMAFGPWLFMVVFGQEWHEVGVYARYLTLYILTSFIASPFENVFNLYEKQNLQLILNIIKLSSVVIVFVISSYLNLSPVNTIGIYSIIMTIYYIVLSSILFRVLKKASNNIFNKLS